MYSMPDRPLYVTGVSKSIGSSSPSTRHFERTDAMSARSAADPMPAADDELLAAPVVEKKKGSHDQSARV
jgi:hypothetical protein